MSERERGRERERERGGGEREREREGEREGEREREGEGEREREANSWNFYRLNTCTCTYLECHTDFSCDELLLSCEQDRVANLLPIFITLHFTIKSLHVHKISQRSQT